MVFLLSDDEYNFWKKKLVYNPEKDRFEFVDRESWEMDPTKPRPPIENRPIYRPEIFYDSYRELWEKMRVVPLDIDNYDVIYELKEVKKFANRVTKLLLFVYDYRFYLLDNGKILFLVNKEEREGVSHVRYFISHHTVASYKDENGRKYYKVYNDIATSSYCPICKDETWYALYIDTDGYGNLKCLKCGREIRSRNHMSLVIEDVNPFSPNKNGHMALLYIDTKDYLHSLIPGKGIDNKTKYQIDVLETLRHYHGDECIWKKEGSKEYCWVKYRTISKKDRLFRLWDGVDTPL